ncbi:hypothetical protein [Pseudoxanthomonas wuyuanensis]
MAFGVSAKAAVAVAGKARTAERPPSAMAGRTRAASIYGVSRIALATGFHIDIHRTWEKNLKESVIGFDI